VIMPDEVALQLHDFELVVVHLGDHFWLPLLIELAKLLRKVNRSVFHLTSLMLAILLFGPSPNQQHRTAA
jgi:hypothetical protein